MELAGLDPKHRFISCFIPTRVCWTLWGVFKPAIFLCVSPCSSDFSLSELFDFTNFGWEPAQVWQGNIFAGSCAKCNLCKFNKKYLEYEETKLLINSCSEEMNFLSFFSIIWFLFSFSCLLFSSHTFFYLHFPFTAPSSLTPSLPSSLHPSLPPITPWICFPPLP